MEVDGGAHQCLSVVSLREADRRHVGIAGEAWARLVSTLG
jgi:hypothetical protein